MPEWSRIEIRGSSPKGGSEGLAGQNDEIADATGGRGIAQLVRDYTRNPVRLSFGSTLKPSESVRLQAYEVADGDKAELLFALLSKERGRCLVFSRTKRGTDKIAKGLSRRGINAYTSELKMPKKRPSAK